MVVLFVLQGGFLYHLHTSLLQPTNPSAGLLFVCVLLFLFMFFCLVFVWPNYECRRTEDCIV